MENKIKTFAAIIIPTLCRYEHLKRCVESLERCKYSENTEVYIAVDFPKSPKHEEGHGLILQYLKTRSFRFKQTHIIIRDRNFGLGPKGNRAMMTAEVVKTHDTFITTEDDNVFSYTFIEYMNICLSYYKKD